MFQTSLAYLGDYLAKYFFSDYEGDPKARVVYGDNESYFNKLKEKKLILPGLVYTLTQLTLPHGPSKPTGFDKFRGYDNAGGTQGLQLNAKRAMLACSMSIYCTDAMQSFDFIQKYFEFQSDSVIPVTYWPNDNESITVDCALCNFEDLSIPPAGRKSSDYSSTGLIYQLEAGFSMPTLFLVSKYRKLIRCVRYQKALKPVDNSNQFLLFKIADITETEEHKEELKQRFNLGITNLDNLPIKGGL